LLLAANSQVLLQATADLGFFLLPMTLNMAKSSKSRLEQKINVRPAVGGFFRIFGAKVVIVAYLGSSSLADKLNFVSAPQQHHGFAANDPKNGEIKQISPGTKNQCTPISEGPIVRYSSKSCSSSFSRQTQYCLRAVVISRRSSVGKYRTYGQTGKNKTTRILEH
jgi:hypothetical protein